MKNKFFILLLSIIFMGCSVKMKTNHLPDGITEYDDVINGDRIIIKMKGRYCLPDAEIHSSYVVGKLKLSKYCKVVSANYYSDDGEFLQKPDKYQLKQLQNSFSDYMEQRDRIEAINGSSKPNNDIKYIGLLLPSNNKQRCKKENLSLEIIQNDYDKKFFARYKFAPRNEYSVILTQDENSFYGESEDLKFNSKFENNEFTGTFTADGCKGNFKLMKTN